MSKGSGRRPSFIPKDEWDRRYAETFADQRNAPAPMRAARRAGHQIGKQDISLALAARFLDVPRSTLPPDRTVEVDG